MTLTQYHKVKQIFVRVDILWMLARPICYVGYNGETYTGMVTVGLALNPHSSYLTY